MRADRAVVYVVDDDASMRSSLDSLLRSVGLDVHLHASAQEFMKAPRPDSPSCLLLDVRLPGMSGLSFQQELTKAGIALPVIFITGHGDVPMTARAMLVVPPEGVGSPPCTSHMIRVTPTRAALSVNSSGSSGRRQGDMRGRLRRAGFDARAGDARQADVHG